LVQNENYSASSASYYRLHRQYLRCNKIYSAFFAAYVGQTQLQRNVPTLQWVCGMRFESLFYYVNLIICVLFFLKSFSSNTQGKFPLWFLWGAMDMGITAREMVSGVTLTLRLLMSYIYIYIWSS